MSGEKIEHTHKIYYIHLLKTIDKNTLSTYYRKT